VVMVLLILLPLGIYNHYSAARSAPRAS
jgi:hypothetical protein